MENFFHGINCTCCKKKSPETVAILEEISKLFDDITPGGSKQSVIKNAEKIRSKFPPAMGNLTPLVNLTRAVFSLPDGDIDFEALKMDDPNKSVGPFKAIDLTDNPLIDVSKAVDFSAVNLSSFSALKISLTVPTIDATMQIAFGPISIGLNFKIGFDTFAWSPAFKYPDPAAALEGLKGNTYNKIVTEGGSETIGELKDLAKKQFSAIPSAKNALNAAKTKEDFFAIARGLKANIYKTVDVYEEAKALQDNAKKVGGLLLEDLVPLPDPENTNPSDIGAIDLCVEKTVTPAPYRSDEVKKVHDDICGKTPDPDLNVEVDLPNTEVPSSESELEKVENFAKEVGDHGKKMDECGKKKNAAVNEWYSLYSHQILNRITRRYFEKMRDYLESFYTGGQVFLRARDSAINELVQINSEISLLYDRINSYNLSLYPISNVTYEAFQIPGTGIKTNLEDFNADPTGGGSVISEIAGQLNSKPLFLNVVQLSTTLEATRQTLSAEYVLLINARDAAIAGVTQAQAEFNLYRAQNLNQGGTSLDSIRFPLRMELSLLSNMVGYNDFGGIVGPDDPPLKWQVKTQFPQTYTKAISLWNEVKQSTTETPYGNLSGCSQPLEDYITFLDLPEVDSDGNIIRPRKGIFETGIWVPFYSAKRVDYFFTPQEQGYNGPKPEYDDEGNLLGTVVKKKIVNGLEDEIEVEVPSSAQNLKVDTEKAIEFFTTLEERTRVRVRERVESIENGPVFSNFVSILDTAARQEAAVVYFNEVENRGFLNGPRVLFGVSHLRDFIRKADLIDKYYGKIEDELAKIVKSIEEYNDCIEKAKKGVSDAAKKLAGGNAEDSMTIKEQCKLTLGKDPVGGSPSDGKCPGYTKDCYWKEYTKILQTVSLLPVPELDPQNLSQRLFRYYPVGLQIPVPTPIPAVLPTLAMGIPDPQISIPLPLVWIHLLTFSTPLGTFVVWLTIGGIVPAPLVLFIDEKGDATFIVTKSGPTSIPHPTVGGTNPLEEKSLYEMIFPDNLFKIDIGSFPGNLLSGNLNVDIGNADGASNVIDKLKEKIKSSYTQMEIPDPLSLQGESEEIKERKRKIKKAFEVIPPDQELIEEGIKLVFDTVKNAIDGIAVSDIKIPKDDKKLMMPTLGPGEIVDNLMKMVDTATSAPGDIAGQVLKDLGMGIKTMSLRKKLKELVLQEVDTPEIREFFKEMDLEIAELEASLSFETEPSEKVKARLRKVTKLIKKAVEKVGEKINPDILGFVAAIETLPPLPFPCYTDVSIPAVPPPVLAIIAAIKAAASAIDAMDEDALIELLSFELNLEATLPNAEKLFYKSINGVLDGIPDLIIPTDLADDMFKQTINMVKTIIQKFKVRLPKPGLPMQIAIPGSLIKATMKEVVGAALQILVDLLMAQIQKAIAENNLQGVLAVAYAIKALFGVDLGSIKGADIKAFIGALLDAFVYPALDVVSSIIDAVNALSAPFLSIIELFQFPPKLSLPGKDGPFYDVGEAIIKPAVDLLLKVILPPVFNNLPPIVTLLACSSTPARLAITKLHPTKPFEIIPTWESLSINNIPFLVWLDYMAATAQRRTGIGSTYLVATGYQALP